MNRFSTRFKSLSASLVHAAVFVGWIVSIPIFGEVITFEDRPADGIFPISGPYHKLNWNNFYVYTTAWYSSPNGYRAAARSGSQGVYNAGGSDASISSGLFNLNSAYVAAAWRDGLQLRALGLMNGSLLYSNSYVLSAVSGTQINFNFVGVDSVLFSASGGSQHPGYDADGTNIGLDDLDVSVIKTVVISGQPASFACLAGDAATFAVSAVGVPPFTYQWRFNGTNVPDAVSSSLILTNVQVSDQGEYSVVVSNAYESVISSSATLLVTRNESGSWRVNATTLLPSAFIKQIWL